MIASIQSLSHQILLIPGIGDSNTATDSVVTIDIDPRGKQICTN
jgi:hypothetical protein